MRFMYRVEKGTIAYKLATESLILVVTNEPDYDLFTDDGDFELSALYIDLIKAFTKEVRKEQLKRLKGAY